MEKHYISNKLRAQIEDKTNNLATGLHTTCMFSVKNSLRLLLEL